MNAPEAYRPASLDDLIDGLDRFISDNSRSRDVEKRWLADKLKPTLQLARQCRARLSPEIRQEVNAFEALEVEEEMAKKRREIESMESRLKQLRKPVAA